MNRDNDYDNDGNNIVPCPICLDVYCSGKESGKCPEEEAYSKDHSIEEMVEQKQLPARECLPDEEVVNASQVVELVTKAKEQGAREMSEKIKELVAHSSYNIDPGGRVSERHDTADTVCHEIIEDIKTITPQE